jgi:hypothetical protein
MDNIRFAEGLMSIAHGLNIIAEAIGGGVECLPEESRQFAVPRNQVDEPPVSEPPAPPVSEPPAPPVSERPPTREEVVSYFRGMSQVIGSDAAKAAVAKILAGMDVKAFKDIPEEKLGEFLHQLRTVPGAPANA